MRMYNDLTAVEIRKIRERVFELRTSGKLSLDEVSKIIKKEFDVSLTRERCRQMENVGFRKKWREEKANKAE